MYSHWMSLMLIVGVLSALYARVSPTAASTSQAPCDHPLRILAPSLFTHCATSCIYSDWNSWQTIQTRIPTNKTTCASEYYYVQQQNRTIVLAVGDRADCNEVNQTRKICELS